MRTIEGMSALAGNSIESQTIITDVAAIEVPIQVVCGTLDPFLVPRALRILERMRHVTMQRVEGATTSSAIGWHTPSQRRSMRSRHLAHTCAGQWQRGR
jgi:hypothetical protein